MYFMSDGGKAVTRKTLSFLSPKPHITNSKNPKLKIEGLSKSSD